MLFAGSSGQIGLGRRPGGGGHHPGGGGRHRGRGGFSPRWWGGPSYYPDVYMQPVIVGQACTQRPNPVPPCAGALTWQGPDVVCCAPMLSGAFGTIVAERRPVHPQHAETYDFWRAVKQRL